MRMTDRVPMGNQSASQPGAAPTDPAKPQTGRLTRTGLAKTGISYPAPTMAPVRRHERRRPIDIEALLIWVYRDQKADRVLRHGMGLHEQEVALAGLVPSHSSGDGIATLQRIAALGTRVQGGGPSADALHSDAEITHAAVSALPHPITALLIRHARYASRPDGDAVVLPRPTRETALNGRTKITYAPWDKSHGYGWCEVAWTVSPVSESMIRADYERWHCALSVLALALSRDGRLTHHAVRPPGAPRTPCVRFI
jgi:hypothetical protein